MKKFSISRGKIQRGEMYTRQDYRRQNFLGETTWNGEELESWRPFAAASRLHHAKTIIS